MHEVQKCEHIVIIHERLARAHEHHRIDLLPFFAQQLVDEYDFGEHFARREVARAAMQRRSAERAPHRTARLRRNADAVAIRLPHEHGLDGRAIGKRQHVLWRLRTQYQRHQCRQDPITHLSTGYS